MSEELKIVGLLCNWCCYGGADTAGTARMQYPPNIRIFVGGCHIGDCHYDAGNYKWSRRSKIVEDILEEFGIEKERFLHEWISASEGEKFQTTMDEFYKTLTKLGPLELE